MQFFTLGVYNTDEAAFFAKLADAGIDTFCDIRQRRGVRGATYAFVNSRRLQARLAQQGIRYLHAKGLAPPRETRALQQVADRQAGTAKRSRRALDDVFRQSYRECVLECFDFGAFLRQLEACGSRRIALFCVEEHAAACHRSLVAAELRRLLGEEAREL